MMATLMNSAPAKVVPIALKSLLDLKSGIRKGIVPTMMTIATKSTIKIILRSGSTSMAILGDGILYKLISDCDVTSYLCDK